MAESRSDGESLLRRAIPNYIALTLAIVTGFAIVALVKLVHVLLLLFISFLFAAAISRPSKRLEQLGVPRGVAALLIYALALFTIVGIGWYVIPTLFRQVANLAEEAPSYAERYADIRRRLPR